MAVWRDTARGNPVTPHPWKSQTGFLSPATWGGDFDSPAMGVSFFEGPPRKGARNRGPLKN